MKNTEDASLSNIRGTAFSFGHEAGTRGDFGSAARLLNVSLKAAIEQRELQQARMETPATERNQKP